MKEGNINFDLAWKEEVRKLASQSATRSWLLAAIIAPFYMYFEDEGTESHFFFTMIFTLSVSGFLLLITFLKTRYTISEFITTYGISVMISACTTIMCVITESDNVQYYLLIVSIISITKGLLYVVELKNLLKLSIFNHLLAYSAIFLFRPEPILEIPDILTTMFYQVILLLFSFTGAHMRYALSRDNFIKGLKIGEAQKRGDALLFNILPEEIAEELKEKGKAEAQDFETVSILFSDFKGFTQAAAQLNAKDLVAEINTCFEAFDGIMDKYDIEKIKTIGDAYMAAGGLPVPTVDSFKKTVLAALEMQRFIEERKRNQDAKGRPAFEMRVGIHTGPVVAGIVGVKKFQYDIWGDTVNTAARMESTGEVGKVNISQATYELLKSDPNFVFESRGKVEAKGKGEIEMWFVSNKNSN